MKRDKNATKKRAIDQFQFQIFPVSIAFSRKLDSNFYVYIEKGAQVLGKVDQLINGYQMSHKFSDDHRKSFKISNDKNLTYQWSLYRRSQDQQEEYLQSSVFNIKDRYHQYAQQLERVQTDLYRIYVEKQKRTEIEEIWNDLRHDLTKNQFQISSSFMKFNAKITFKIKIMCDLDLRHQKWKEDRERKKTLRILHSVRKSSVDSRSISSQKPQTLLMKEKSLQSMQPSASLKKQTLNKSTNKKHIQCEREQFQGEKTNNDVLYESQIRVTDPAGMDVTAQVPQNNLRFEPNSQRDYYHRKKSQILSDIIEESYEGSSNVFTKSNQGEKMKSLDEIHEEQETPLFSPLVKTQTYDSLTDQAYCCDFIKRTSTLVHKTSQEFQFQQTYKTSPHKSSQNFSTVQHKTVLIKSQKQKSQSSFQQTRKNNDCDSLKAEEKQGETIQDFNEARKHTIKNVIKIVIIVVLLIVVINSLHFFESGNKKSKRKKVSKDQHKIEEAALNTANKEKKAKHKNPMTQLD